MSTAVEKSEWNNMENKILNIDLYPDKFTDIVNLIDFDNNCNLKF